MPTSNDCSQLQSIMPLNSKVGVAGAVKQSDGEIGTAVRASALEQAVTAVVVSEQHEVFAEKANGFDRPLARQPVERARRLPIAPHQRACGRAGAGAGDEIILLGAQHVRLPLPSFRGVRRLYRIERTACQLSQRLAATPQCEGNPPHRPALTLQSRRRARSKTCATKKDTKSRPRSRRGQDFLTVPCWSSCA